MLEKIEIYNVPVFHAGKELMGEYGLLLSCKEKVLLKYNNRHCNKY